MSAPAVRFPEFDGSWETTTLKGASAINPKSASVPEEFRYIDLESVNAGKLGSVSLIERSGAPSRAQRVLEAGDILYQTVRPYQRNNLHFKLEGNHVASTGYAQLRAHGDAGFLFQIIHTDRFVDQVVDRCTGTSYPAINSTDLAGVEITIPSLPEQRRIADALSAVDAKIDLLDRKRDALARFKAGLMQKLFSQEVRFTRENGSAHPDWEEKEIRDLLTICYGKDHKHLGTGNIPVYGTGGLMRYADTAIHTGPSILIGRKGTIDKPRYVEGPFWTVDTVFYTKVKEGVDPFLLFSILQTVEWLSLNEASGVPSLNANTVGSVLINIPTDIYEQRQISAVLRAFDEKIEAVSRQIATMQAFKKGLLQQMFV